MRGIVLEYILGGPVGEGKVEAGKCHLKFLLWHLKLGNKTVQAGAVVAASPDLQNQSCDGWEKLYG